MQCVGIWLPSFSWRKWFVCTKYNCSKVKHLWSMKIYLKKIQSYFSRGSCRRIMKWLFLCYTTHSTAPRTACPINKHQLLSIVLHYYKLCKDKVWYQVPKSFYVSFVPVLGQILVYLGAGNLTGLIRWILLFFFPKMFEIQDWEAKVIPEAWSSS